MVWTAVRQHKVTRCGNTSYCSKRRGLRTNLCIFWLTYVARLGNDVYSVCCHRHMFTQRKQYHFQKKALGVSSEGHAGGASSGRFLNAKDVACAETGTTVQISARVFVSSVMKVIKVRRVWKEKEFPALPEVSGFPELSG